MMLFLTYPQITWYTKYSYKLCGKNTRYSQSAVCFRFLSRIDVHKYKKIPKTKKLQRRFESKVTKLSASECWEWSGTKLPSGYGVVRYNKGYKKNFVYLAHRVSFALYKNEKLVNGEVVDHVCRNRICVNPHHLRQMGIYENATRDFPQFRMKRNYSLPSLLFRGICADGHPIMSFDDLSKQFSVKGQVMNYKCKICKVAWDATRKKRAREARLTPWQR
jgi:hypothetical protein